MRSSTRLLALVAAAVLGGCSMFTDNIARSASEIATQNAVKAIREVDLDRQVDVTLVGGRTLNTGRGTMARPVQVCVYVVQNADWHPGPSNVGLECNRERDSAVLAVERRMVAPGQVQQFQLKAPGVREAWLVIDADFAQRPAHYVPLTMRIDGHGTVRLSAWLDGATIADGRQGRTGQTDVAAATPERNEAPVVASAAMAAQVMPASHPRVASRRITRASAESKGDRLIGLTLAGGHRLNASREGVGQAVRACAYIVNRADWSPPSPSAPPPNRDPEVLASDCGVLAPNQLRQLQFRAPSDANLWLVIDAAFAQPEAGYAPLRLPVGDGEVVQVAAWVEGRRIYDGRLPLPEDVAPPPPAVPPEPPVEEPPATPAPLTPLNSQPAPEAEGATGEAP